MSWLDQIAVYLPTAILLLGVLAWFAQPPLEYLPDNSDPGSAPEVIARGTDIVIRTVDDLELGAWRVDPEHDNGMAVLYLPGNRGNRLQRAGIGRSLADEGFTTILMDYRGYAGNPGTPDDDGLLRDGQAALAYLNDAGFGNDKIIIVGESLGAGLAVRLAAQSPDEQPAGILLRSPYASIVAVICSVFPFPLSWLVRDRFNPLHYIKSVTVPISVLAGEVDSTISLSQSKYVAKAAVNLHEHTILPGANHDDPRWFGQYLAGKTTELAREAGDA